MWKTDSATRVGIRRGDLRDRDDQSELREHGIVCQDVKHIDDIAPSGKMALESGKVQLSEVL